VLVDALGSLDLPKSFWAELEEAGGAFRFFNPLELRRIAFRDHRKLVVCDERRAFVGGFNISGQEAGDGLARGWRDLAVCIEGPLAKSLAASFDEMFGWAGTRRPRLLRLRRFRWPRLRKGESAPSQILSSSPSGKRSPIRRALLQDLKQARSVRIISAYFLPTWGLRRALVGIARRGGDVQMVLAGQSDVPLSRLAGRALYQRFLRAGIRIFEYQPQVLHSKLVIVGSVVYVGSANLDARSLGINYELVVRVDQPQATRDAERIFQSHLPACREIRPAEWRTARGLWEKLKERLAYLLLARVDPYLARRQLTRLR
jgi:cardiolipin synthase